MIQPQKRSVLLGELRSWAHEQEMPTQSIIRQGATDLTENERVILTRLSETNASSLSRKDVSDSFTELWDISPEWLIYFFPKILYFIVEREFFPMLDVTPYEGLIFGIFEEDHLDGRRKEFYEMIPESRLKLVGECLIWLNRYRMDNDCRFGDFVNTPEFRSAFRMDATAPHHV